MGSIFRPFCCETFPSRTEIPTGGLVTGDVIHNRGADLPLLPAVATSLSSRRLPFLSSSLALFCNLWLGASHPILPTVSGRLRFRRYHPCHLRPRILPPVRLTDSVSDVHDESHTHGTRFSTSFHCKVGGTLSGGSSGAGMGR